MNKINDKKQVEKLIAFFKTLKQMPLKPKAKLKLKPTLKPKLKPKLKLDQADYSSWNQTEEEYSKEQADWLEKIKQKKKIKKSDE